MSAAGRNQGRRRLAGQPGVASVTRLLPLPPQAFLTALPAEIGGLGSAGLASPHRRRASHSAFCTRAAAAAGGVLWVRRAWSKVKSGSGDEQRQAYLLAHSPRYRPFPPPPLPPQARCHRQCCTPRVPACRPLHHCRPAQRQRCGHLPARAGHLHLHRQEAGAGR